MNAHRGLAASFPLRRSLVGSASVALLALAALTPVAASARPLAAASSLAASPSPLVFNDVVGGTASAPRTLTITNTGASTVTVSRVALAGKGAAQFHLPTPPAVPFAIAAGAAVSVDITFDPQASTGPIAATLQVTSDAGALKARVRGLATAGTQGSKEPSLQWILDTWQIPVSVGDPDPSTAVMPYSAVGDEVKVRRFMKAGAGPVTLKVLGAFGPAAHGGTSTTYCWYVPGNPTMNTLFSVPSAQSETLDPAVTGATSFDPGTSAFGLCSRWFFYTPIRDVFTEDSLNIWDPRRPHKARVYPYKQSSGMVVPNTYVVAMEEGTSLYDWQDLTVVISNVQPAP